ncbi:Por secretion system C-terminal sorting domain-containing protein [Pontibacter akesuensis]|uniref:Por secretion system C-terminal sorting domain-containing protein n=1 Tax=Pontibacter akesuensis TaxID=388950 RepID=A0A1I7GGW6_9BACT|nr:T9SS type A sorting domain-containing protein [Pontibacter akesuensis]SFU47684.1 Por secretion system C-terminal sorting domain-containing protein [Pontibacter akesuensis]
MKKLTTKSLIILLMSYLYVFPGHAQLNSSQTANTSVKPFSEQFGYGSNMGYFSNGWDDKKIATVLSNAGVNTVRASLPDYFIEQWGTPIRLKEFQYYTNDLGMKGITVFIGNPSDAHQDKTVYPGCTQPSKLFANLYEPIWNSDGSVNKNNYYAEYVNKLVQTYGPYVKVWEVVNEPDLTHANATEWLTRAPLPSELPNTRAPFYHYIRMLRISYEVIKKYNPDSYVTPGGLGYPEYLDALLRYTDNPNGGAVTSQYPNKGGAYFDLLSYHVYPAYFMSVWKDGGFVYTRNSDNAAAQAIGHKNNFEKVLNKYGYNGSTYPKKDLIITETNVSRRSSGNHHGSDEMQRNFGIKTLVLAQKNNVKQVHIYAAAETIDAPPADQTVSLTNSYELMGLYENLKRDAPGSEKINQEGIGYKTTSQLLEGYTYDAGRTSALNMPASMEGAAFKKDGQFVYVLWAKALTDKSETASATYSFPSSWNIGTVERKDWNHSSTGSTKTQASTGIVLNSAPAFFTASGSSTTEPALASQTITFAPLAAKVLGDAPFTVSATASSGLAVSFRIVSGPATISGNTITLTATGTVTVEAMQAGNDAYSAANPVRQSFAVNAATTPEPTPEPEPAPAPAPGQTGSITRDFWTSVRGSSVADVPVGTAPTKTTEETLFEAPSGQGSTYGQRIRGYVTAPVTGQYTFWIAADDKAELYLSSSEDPARKTRIAYSAGWTSARQWDKYDTQQSVKVTLEAGKRYYIEALHLQSWGGDNLAVGWQLPNGQLQRPIAGQHLSPYVTLSSSSTSALLGNGADASMGETPADLTAYPNPFTTDATVAFSLAAATEVSLEVYDLQGRLVRQLYKGSVNAGELNRFTLKAQGLDRGVYIIRLVTGSKVFTQKIVLEL